MFESPTLHLAWTGPSETKKVDLKSALFGIKPCSATAKFLKEAIRSDYQTLNAKEYTEIFAGDVLT